MPAITLTIICETHYYKTQRLKHKSFTATPQPSPFPLSDRPGPFVPALWSG